MVSFDASVTASLSNHAFEFQYVIWLSERAWAVIPFAHGVRVKISRSSTIEVNAGMVTLGRSLVVRVAASRHAIENEQFALFTTTPRLAARILFQVQTGAMF
jgi:hypothetical protein